MSSKARRMSPVSGSFVIKASELPRLSSFWSRGPTGMRFSAAAAAAAGSQTVSLRFASAPALTHGRVTHALLNTSGERSRSISSCCDIRLSDLWFLCCSQTSPGLRGTYELLYPRFLFPQSSSNPHNPTHALQGISYNAYGITYELRSELFEITGKVTQTVSLNPVRSLHLMLLNMFIRFPNRLLSQAYGLVGNTLEVTVMDQR